MTSSGSSAMIRAISSLASGSPGAIAPASTAASRRSSRRSALRAALSGPWQAKQFSARIGRMSRLYSSLPAARAEPFERTKIARAQAIILRSHEHTGMVICQACGVHRGETG